MSAGNVSGRSAGQCAGGERAPAHLVKELSAAGVTVSSWRKNCSPPMDACQCIDCGAPLGIVNDVHQVRRLSLSAGARREPLRHREPQQLHQEQFQQEQPQSPQPQFHDAQLRKPCDDQQHVSGGWRDSVESHGQENETRRARCHPRPETREDGPSEWPENVHSSSIEALHMRKSAAQQSLAQDAKNALCGGGRRSSGQERGDRGDPHNEPRLLWPVEDRLVCATCFRSTLAELHQQLQLENELLHQYQTQLDSLRGRDEEDGNCRTPHQPLQAEPLRRAGFSARARLHHQLERRSPKLEDTQAQCPREGSPTKVASLPASREELLLQELEAVEIEREEATAREDDMFSEQLVLQQQKEELWLLLAQQQRERLLEADETAAVKRQLQHAQAHLQQLNHVSVINDAFFITMQDGFPSINSCRLGRVATTNGRNATSPPSWDEINLGWGHMCFLLDVLFRKLYVHPRHYRLIPRGPSSCLVRKGDGVTLPLQGGGGESALGRLFFSSHRFDAAAAAFVECVQEFFEALTHFARQPWPPYSASNMHPLRPPELPFLIEGDRIGGLSIRMQHSQDEIWTKAVKYLLIDMKWLLAYTEKACAASLSARGQPRGYIVPAEPATEEATSKR